MFILKKKPVIFLVIVIVLFILLVLSLNDDIKKIIKINITPVLLFMMLVVTLLGLKYLK